MIRETVLGLYLRIAEPGIIDATLASMIPVDAIMIYSLEYSNGSKYIFHIHHSVIYYTFEVNHFRSTIIIDV